MKLHDLRPADGSRRPKTRVGRGIAAGKGKTAGRGTKGQKARAGGSIPAWFEGGQTPLHMRIPKLRGFRNPFKVEYEVVNVGRIAALVAAGRLEAAEPSGASPKGKGKPAAVTVNQEILRATGLVSSLDKPMKVLGSGEVDVPLFVVADAFTRSAREKIEAAGGTVQVLEVPTGPLAALGVEGPAAEPVAGKATGRKASAAAEAAEVPVETAGEPAEAPAGEPETPVEAAAAVPAEAPEASVETVVEADEVTELAGPGPEMSAEAVAETKSATPRPTRSSRPTRSPSPPTATPAPDPCSSPSSTRSARRTSGAGSSTSWGS